jgi:transcriptional regulator with XRE-family HTH domain
MSKKKSMPLTRPWRALPGCAALRAAMRDGRAADLPASMCGVPTHAEMALRLGVSSASVYAWCIGFRRPGPTARELLERVAGIPRAAWLTAEEEVRIALATAS